MEISSIDKFRKRGQNFLKLLGHLLCLILFLSGRCQAKKASRSLSRVTHLLGFCLVQPQLVTLCFLAASEADKETLPNPCLILGGSAVHQVENWDLMGNES